MVLLFSHLLHAGGRGGGVQNRLSKRALVIQWAVLTPAIVISVTFYWVYCITYRIDPCSVTVLMLKTTELSKRKRSQGSTDTELSPSSVQLSKKLATPNSIMNSVGHPNVPLTPTKHLTPSPTHYQVPYPQMALPGSYPMVSPGAGTGPQQAFISDLDIRRIAEAVSGIVVNDVQTLITPLKDQISTLEKENLELRREIDELEMYSRRYCVRVAVVSEDRTDTDDVILDIANKLDIPIKREEITVSHRVGPKNNDRPRQIIARITNYELRHRLLKSS